MIQRSTLYLCMLILASCTKGNHKSETLDKDTAITQVLDKTVRQLYIQEGLHCTGHSAKAMDEILQLGLFLKTDHKMNMQKARDLIVIAHGQLLKNINESEAIRPYLKQHPFNERDVDIMIEYVGNIPYTQDGLIAVVNCFDKKIYYKIKQDKYTPSKVHQLETLDEAIRIVSDQLDKK